MKEDVFMVILKNTLKNSYIFLKSIVKWVLISLFVGVLSGVIGSIFHIAIDKVTEYREANGFVLYFLPVGGIIIAGIYFLCKKFGRVDTNRVLEAVETEEKVPLIMAPLIFVSTVLTHLFGGSAGREGAALQLGGSIGYNVGSLLRLNKKDKHIIVMAGMSGVFAALFGTPLTAMFFSIEVTSIGIMYYVALVPCFVSAITAAQIAKAFSLHAVHFSLSAIPEISVQNILLVAVVALCCAICCILFCVSMKKCEHFMEKYLKNAFVRAAVGGVLIVTLSLVLGTRDYNGAGMDIISRAIGGEARWEAFILKILFTVITISAGFKGGEIVPAFFIGSTLGCTVGALVGIDAGFAAAIGFVALFCGVVNCPVASLILSVEVFGAEGIVFFALAVAISFMMSGYTGLYKSQRIMYSKTNFEFIDSFAK